MSSSVRPAVIAGLGSLAVVAVLAVSAPEARAQGCVASRLDAPNGPLDPEGQSFFVPKHRWQASFGFRGFRSHRHFVGSVEQNAENVAKGLAERDRASSEVINHVYIPELALGFGVNDRLSVTAALPYFGAVRRSPWRSEERPSYTTSAHGIGDLTLTGRFWVAEPSRHTRQNLAVGIGVKAPTGNDRASDSFLVSVDPDTGERQTSLRPVDQSIQPGDGGWGIVAEVQAFKSFGRVTAFASGSYLSNPREQNDFLRNPDDTDPDPSSAYLSIADQFGARAGVGAGVWKGLGVSLGARLEGVPSSDLIGGDMGRRRPGYSIAIEPGLSYSWGKYAASLSVPYLVRRVRTQNISDKIESRETGEYHNGDAAFADYVVIVGISRRF